jgi:hypothetical protein
MISQSNSQERKKDRDKGGLHKCGAHYKMKAPESVPKNRRVVNNIFMRGKRRRVVLVFHSSLEFSLTARRHFLTVAGKTKKRRLIFNNLRLLATPLIQKQQ